jgi:hypothetical protein
MTSKVLLGFFALVVACLLLFVFPLLNSYEQEDQISYNIAYKSTTTFVDAVRNKGYITPKMYNDFTESLSMTNNIFDIQLEHESKRYNPLYTDPANMATFNNGFEIYYDSTYTDQILAKLYPNNNLPITDISRRYYLQIGDQFNVTVKNKNVTKAMLIRNFLTGSSSSNPTRIFIPYGGMVQNEDY